MKILRLLGCIGCVLFYAGPVLLPVLLLLLLLTDISAAVFWGSIGFIIACFLCATFFIDSPNQPATK